MNDTVSNERPGFFKTLEKATTSPLFGLGMGLLSGSPQQGFSNARSLSQGRFGPSQFSDTQLRQLSETELRQLLQKIHKLLAESGSSAGY